MSQGVIRRKDKEMSRDAIEALLARASLAHFATVGPDGDPYVVPNLFVWAEGLIYLHTAAAVGHFRRNVAHRPRLSFTVAEAGQVFPYGEFECDTSISYASVVGFGAIRIATEREAKAQFFDRFLAKYGGARADRPQGFYPRLDEVTVYCVAPEQLTGKTGPLPPLAQQWPALNATRSPGAVPPRKA